MKAHFYEKDRVFFRNLRPQPYSFCTASLAAFCVVLIPSYNLLIFSIVSMSGQVAEKRTASN